ncbi:MbcA/ParS/Xre antitoxin family protein [Aurantimonas endophytica]|uniref:Uncharacterized protein (DUF2384 family) n=1 Tax=Aurantimonas endophytica TaxID=1522175 RepID=A0A7W6MR70_9HYPH|nr:antitoxin Xre/MbcA/ParS toxin-binding domain-containing protein [Aurantimonas endophytica]MBB4004730.1 uncharacterized protein (DUF2384 family) [Aurantimonas endophytica]MCO6405544.1 DUF2384 domain-containing protein [Aurantimonas endophytica]
MVNLIEVTSHIGDFVSEPISHEEGAASFRAAVNLFGRWGITDEQAATLLDMNVRTYRRWKAQGPNAMGRDTRTRLSILMGIHKALRVIFGKSERVYQWIDAPNARFGDRTALDVMLNGEMTDLVRVRRYLDAERGAW